jgi:hypothetical protein
MIDIAGSMAIGTSVVLLSYLAWRSAAVITREFSLRSGPLSPGSEFESEACPPEVVSRIFSGQDWEFVAATHADPLKKFFRWERKSVALLWVRETSAGIKGIIREHSALARGSENLEFTTELKIFFQYAQLRMICALLFALIALGGPHWVRGLALHANGLFARFGQAQEALRAATEEHSLRSAGSI